MFTQGNLYRPVRRGVRLSSMVWMLQLAALLSAPRPAAAASLQEVTGFGNNPSNAKMYWYVPDKVAASPPILVAIHYCGGSANAYFTGTGYRALADQFGFIVIYPQTTSSDGCFDVHSEATLKHDGGGDSASIAAMVRYTIMKRGADAGRVYVTGTSSGAMLTNVLLGAYPDVFRAGAAFAGVPYGCFAGQSAWNSACASGQTTKTAQQWGDLVRAGYPGYTGARPRVQLWHGDKDETLNFHNFGEAIKQWTNVLGVSEMPTTTEKNVPQSGWTRTRYADAGGVVRVEAVLEAGMTHNLSIPAMEVVRFFGLDGKGDPGGAAAGAGGAVAAGSGGSSGGSGSAAGGMGGAAGAGAGTSASAGRGWAAAGSGATTPIGPAGSAAPRPALDADAGVMSGVAGALAPPGMNPPAAEGGSSPVGFAGNESAPPEPSSSSCSVHRHGARGSSAVTWMLFVLAAILRERSRRSRARRC